MDLGLSDSEFWATSLPMLTALMRARDAQRDRDDYRFGLIAALVASACGDKKASPEKFFPNLKKRQKPQTPEQMLRVAEALVRALGGG